MCSREGSNLQPLVPQTNALSIELRELTTSPYYTLFGILLDMDQKRDTSTIKALQESLAHHERDLRIEFRTLTKKEKDILMKTVKLQEEVGELANEILAVLALQRKSKLAKFQMANLYAEFSDVVIASASLANTLGVDLDRAISKKMETLITEYSKDR